MNVLSLPPLAIFIFEALLVGLIWAVWVVLNLWIWQKTKANGNLLMLIGSGAFAVFNIIGAFSQSALGSYWLHVAALVCLTLGFFFTVKPLVDAQIAALKAKVHNMTAKKDGGGTPPAPKP